MNDFITNLIRTTVAGFIGYVAAKGATKGVVITPDLQVTIIAALTGILAALYTAAVNFIAKAYPKVGYLLGVPKTPTYKE